MAFEADWYVSLRRDRSELAILDASHPTIPVAGRAASGMLINLEVDDVDAEYDRLVTHGPLDALVALRSEDFGQRHFVVAGPDGVLIGVITPIEPSDEFAAQSRARQTDRTRRTTCHYELGEPGPFGPTDAQMWDSLGDG